MDLYQRHFTYNPTTGKLYRKTQQGNHKAGTEITAKSKDGYIRVQFQRKKILGHRLAWALFYGTEPPEFIDHINRCPSDNRITNLRAATNSENQYNKSMPLNSTGIKGIYRHKQSGGYMAAISCEGKAYTKYSQTDLECLVVWLATKRAELHKQYARV